MPMPIDYEGRRIRRAARIAESEDDRYARNPFAYDNRRDRGDWPEAKRNIARRRRAAWTKVIVSILVVAALATLWHTQTKCVELNGSNSRVCTD